MSSNTVPGTTDVLVDQRPPLAQIAITPDREAAARYGINVADIADLIQTGIGGGRREPSLHRRAPLRRHGAVPGRGAQQPRSDRQPGAHLELGRAGAAVAGREHPAADRRKHHQSRHEPPLSHGEAQFRRPQPSGARRAGARRPIAEKVKFDPQPLSPRMERRLRRRAAGGSATCPDPRPDPRPDDRAAICRSSARCARWR